MLSGRMLLLSASCWLLVVLGSSEELIEERSPGDTAIKTQEEEELIEALQEVLEKLKNKQLPSSEKKLGWVPAVKVEDLTLYFMNSVDLFVSGRPHPVSPSVRS
ncbi:hypothetical protein ABVT39_023191 [Epinephelus coioides]